MPEKQDGVALDEGGKKQIKTEEVISITKLPQNDNPLKVTSKTKGNTSRIKKILDKGYYPYVLDDYKLVQMRPDAEYTDNF